MKRKYHLVLQKLLFHGINWDPPHERRSWNDLTQINLGLISLWLEKKINCSRMDMSIIKHVFVKYSNWT